MTEDEGRNAVVAEAMTWLGTPYHHHGKLKGVGVDCAQIVLAVYAAVGLVEDFDTGYYPPDWHMHRDGERYRAIIGRLAGEISEDQLKPGDVILFKFGRAFSHGAILIGGQRVVHANRKDGCVVLGDLDRDVDLLHRDRSYFSYWAKSDAGRLEPAPSSSAPLRALGQESSPSSSAPLRALGQD